MPVLDARERVLLPLRLPDPLARLLPLLRLLPELLARLLPLVPELLLRLLLARPFELLDRELDDFELPDREDDDLLFVVPPPERALVPALSGDITLLPGNECVPARTERLTRLGA